MRRKTIDKRGSLKSNRSKRQEESKRPGKRKVSYRARLFISNMLMFCLILIVGLILSLTVFFKIEDIQVKGNTIYSCDEIIKKSSIKKGNNLFLSSIKKGKRRIQKELPYIEKINISRKLPNMVIIEVEDAKTYYSIENEDKYVLINREGKIVDICEERKDCLQVNGVELEEVVVGEEAIFKDKTIEKNFKDLFNELKKWNISNIKKIDFSDSANIMINYKNLIDINLGFYEDVGYKIRTAQEIINGKLKDGERGVLDLSSVASDNKSYFMPE